MKHFIQLNGKQLPRYWQGTIKSRQDPIFTYPKKESYPAQRRVLEANAPLRRILAASSWAEAQRLYQFEDIWLRCIGGIRLSCHRIHIILSGLALSRRLRFTAYLDWHPMTIGKRAYHILDGTPDQEPPRRGTRGTVKLTGHIRTSLVLPGADWGCHHQHIASLPPIFDRILGRHRHGGGLRELSGLTGHIRTLLVLPGADWGLLAIATTW